jgi:hypothetical protein
LAQIEHIAKTPENQHIMKQLKEFYEKSPITTVAGKELMSINRVKHDQKSD